MPAAAIIYFLGNNYTNKYSIKNAEKILDRVVWLFRYLPKLHAVCGLSHRIFSAFDRVSWD